MPNKKHAKICFDNHPNALPDDRLYIEKSDIHGHGIFTKKVLLRGEYLGISHLTVNRKLVRTPLGGYLNHSFDPNCNIVKIHTTYLLKTIRMIQKGDELTLDYRDHDCGEGIE